MAVAPVSDAYIDVVELCALLQSFGYSVKSSESCDANMSHDGGPKTVIINCPMSGLNVVLESRNTSCSCPAQAQSGVWHVSGVERGKMLEQEFGCSLLGSLPKCRREKLSMELHAIIRSIMGGEDKSASMTELKTPEKILNSLKAETPTRYRSLDTLTAGAHSQQLPEPGPLQRMRPSECEAGPSDTKKMCGRQSTYTLSTPGNGRSRNKTSSPISGRNSLEDKIMACEQLAEDLRHQLSLVRREFADKNDSSMSSLALDVSKISVIKGAGCSKAQFASSPNLSTLDDHKTRLKRSDSASTSQLAPKTKESKMSRLRRLSPNIFKSTKDRVVKPDRFSLDGRTGLSGLFKPKIVTPIITPKYKTVPEPSPNLSASSRKKYGHVKSTIPRPAKRE